MRRRKGLGFLTSVNWNIGAVDIEEKKNVNFGGSASIKAMTMQLNAELINEEEVSGAKPHTYR